MLALVYLSLFMLVFHRSDLQHSLLFEYHPLFFSPPPLFPHPLIWTLYNVPSLWFRASTGSAVDAGRTGGQKGVLVRTGSEQ